MTTLQDTIDSLKLQHTVELTAMAVKPEQYPTDQEVLDALDAQDAAEEQALIEEEAALAAAGMPITIEVPIDEPSTLETPQAQQAETQPPPTGPKKRGRPPGINAKSSIHKHIRTSAEVAEQEEAKRQRRELRAAVLANGGKIPDELQGKRGPVKRLPGEESIYEEGTFGRIKLPSEYAPDQVPNGLKRLELLKAEVARQEAAMAHFRGGKHYCAGDPTRLAPQHFTPTQEQRENVRFLASVGVDSEHIAKVIRDLDGDPITKLTCEKVFDLELAEGIVDLTTKVASAMVRKATMPNLDMAGVTAAQFILARRSKWLEPKQLQVTGADGGAIKSEDVRKLDVTDRAAEFLQHFASLKAASVRNEIVVAGESKAQADST